MLRTRLVVIGAAALLLTVACGEGKSGTSAGTATDGDEPTVAASSPTAKPTGPAPVIVSKKRGGSVAINSGIPAQPGAGGPGLTVSHTEKATIPTDAVFAVASFLSRTGAVALPEADIKKIRDGLAAAGFTDVDIQNDGRFGPYALIRTRVPLNDLAASAKKSFDAIEAAVGRPEQTGAQFALSECVATLEPVRRAAFKNLETKAKSAASASGLSLGPIVAASETRGFNPYGQPQADPCDPASEFQIKGPGSFLPIDSKPEVTVSLDVTVTYALAGAPAQTASAGTLTTTGSARVVAVADEAYVVVFVQPNYGPTGPRPIAQRDKDDVLAKLKALGVAAEDVEFSSSNFGNPTVVSVDMHDLAKAAKDGRAIADVIEEVMGQGQAKGLVFQHSRCGEILDEARKEALADARDRAERLASATGLKLSKAPRAVTDTGAPASPYGGPALADPCDEDLSVLAFGGYGPGGTAKPFDAKAELEVASSLTVSFATTE